LKIGHGEEIRNDSITIENNIIKPINVSENSSLEQDIENS
jgi:hypothetical protein